MTRLSDFSPYSKLMFQLFGSPIGVAAELNVFVDDYGDYVVTSHTTWWY